MLGKKEVDDGATRCGDKGFHSCEAPLDVLRHYPNINGNRFFVAEAGGDWSNIYGGNDSNLVGGNDSNIAGGDWSNISGGNRSNLIGSNDSNLIGGNLSVIVGRNGCKAKGGIRSAIVLMECKHDDNGNYVPMDVKAEIVDGVRIKADTWYKLANGEFVEVDV